MIDIIYGWLVIQVTENQFFSGALGAGVFTFLLYQIRSFPNKAWGVFKHQFTVMLTIKSDADFFGWVQEWLGALPYTKRARRIQLDGHYGNSEHVKWVVTLGEGQHFFWHRGRPIWLSYELIEPEGGSYNWHHRLTFYAFGRHHVRRLLYMPAVVAIRCNPNLKRKYEALVAKGKPRKVALTAVMRKLLVLANTLVQQDRIWTVHVPAAGA